MKAPVKERALRVAVTGATGDLGLLLVPRLEADPRVESILAIDLAKPRCTGKKVAYRRIDLTHHDAEPALVAALQEAQADVLYHLAFVSAPAPGRFAHELEVMGTLRALAAVEQAGVRRVVVPSLTAVYGARKENPGYLREDAPLAGCPQSRFISDKVEVEQQLRAFHGRHPEINVLVLRFAPILGLNVNNPVTRLLRARVVPTLLGFDPLWQAIHQDDAVRALHLALTAPGTGAFNVVGRGVVSVSGLVRGAGRSLLPLPGPVARAALSALAALGALAIPPSLLDYIRYAWLADGRRAAEDLGFLSDHDARSAVAALGGP